MTQPDSPEDQPVDELDKDLDAIFDQTCQEIRDGNLVTGNIITKDTVKALKQYIQAECNRALAAQRQSLKDEIVKAIGEDEPASASVYKAHYRDNRPTDTLYSQTELQINNEIAKGRNQMRAELRTAISTIFENKDIKLPQSGKEKTNAS